MLGSPPTISVLGFAVLYNSPNWNGTRLPLASNCMPCSGCTTWMVPDGVYDVRTLSIPIFAGRPLLSAGSVLKYGLGMKSWYRLLQSRLLTEPTPPSYEYYAPMTERKSKRLNSSN